MRIKNSTRYPTRQLRSLFAAVYRALAKHEGPLPTWKNYTFDVVYCRRVTGASGCATYGGAWAKIRLARGQIDTARVAKLVDHELQHSYGYRHEAMRTGRHYYAADYTATFAWARERFGPKLVEREPEVKPKIDHQEHRYRLVLEGIDRWERKLKTAQTRLKNLRRKARYYDRALAAKKGA